VHVFEFKEPEKTGRVLLMLLSIISTEKSVIHILSHQAKKPTRFVDVIQFLPAERDSGIMGHCGLSR
jgi:hypothetical protein